VSCAGKEIGRTRARHGGAREREGRGGRGGGVAEGTDVCVRVPASRRGQGYYMQKIGPSALYWASYNGLAGTVAKLLALGADATLTTSVRAGISLYRYPHVLICIRISPNTIVCNTAWKPERSSLVSFLIVRDNTGQARNKLRSRLWTLEGLVPFRMCIHSVCLSVCVRVCACTCVMYLDVVACVCACMHGEGIYADRVRARERSGMDEHTDLTC